MKNTYTWPLVVLSAATVALGTADAGAGLLADVGLGVDAALGGGGGIGGHGGKDGHSGGGNDGGLGLGLGLGVGVSVNLPSGVTLPSGMKPQSPPCDECSHVYHPPHHGIDMDGCDNDNENGWHWVHPGTGHPSQPAYQWTTSVISTTQTSTIYSCPPEVHNCPASSTIYTTKVVPATTTICPVLASSTSSAAYETTTIRPAASSTSAAYETTTIRPAASSTSTCTTSQTAVRSVYPTTNEKTVYLQTTERSVYPQTSTRAISSQTSMRAMSSQYPVVSASQYPVASSSPLAETTYVPVASSPYMASPPPPPSAPTSEIVYPSSVYNSPSGPTTFTQMTPIGTANTTMSYPASYTTASNSGYPVTAGAGQNVQRVGVAVVVGLVAALL